MADPLDHKVLTGLVNKLDVDQTLIGMDNLAPESPVPSNTFEWDEITRSRNMAEFSSPDGEAHIVDNQGIIKRVGRTASIREKKVMDAKTMGWLRRPGTESTQYGRQALRREMRHLRNRVDKRTEWMIWEALHNKIDYSRDGYDFTVNYNIPNDHQNAPGTLWSNTGSATPHVDLLEWARKIREDSGFEPDRVYMTSKVMKNLIDVDAIQTLIGDNGLTERVAETGRLQRLAGLDLIIYDAVYEDSSGTVKNFIGEDDIVMTPDPASMTENLVTRMVAPALDPKANFQSQRFSKSWEEEDPAQTQALIEYQVVPVIAIPEAVYVTNVL